MMDWAAREVEWEGMVYPNYLDQQLSAYVAAVQALPSGSRPLPPYPYFTHATTPRGGVPDGLPSGQAARQQASLEVRREVVECYMVLGVESRVPALMGCEDWADRRLTFQQVKDVSLKGGMRVCSCCFQLHATSCFVT
jgi:hypothetical protein